MANRRVKTLSGPLKQGKQILVIDADEAGAGSHQVDFVIDADSIIVSLWVESVGGTLDVTVDTFTEDGKSVNIITMPQATAASTDLLIRKAAASMDRVRVRAVYTGAAKFEVRARGIGTGEASVRILAANEALASQTDVGTSATLLIPAALNDRAGLVIKNNNTGAGEVLYLGFSLAGTTPAVGYPIYALESLGVDVSAGQEVYAIGTTTIDVRILEASS